jgi:thioredoxin reductase
VSAAAAAGDEMDTQAYEVVVVGAGPAGLTAALNLVRARRRTLVIDSNRPRNAATLNSHGYLTRDGISPLELRRLGREEVGQYPDAEFATAQVGSVEVVGEGFRLEARGVRGAPDREVITRAVLIASGLSETLPDVPGLRIFYGTHVHSCVECDGYEQSDAPLAFIGDTEDLAERALLLGQWSSDLIVFTNGVGTVTGQEEGALAARGIRVERRPVAEIVGDRATMTGVLLSDGEIIPRTGGFVRPHWKPAFDLASQFGLEHDGQGLIIVDAYGRTSHAGIYAAGDSTPPGPQQLIVAAGAGATVAATINRDLLGPMFPAHRPVLAAPSQ